MSDNLLSYNMKLQKSIQKLKKENNAILFAHNYQRPEIQEICDWIGDSLYLAKKIKEIPAGTKIIYAAVKFMAETAAILNPKVSIYFPVPDALCPMAAFCTPEILKNYRKNNPGVPIVLYINSTSEAKSYCDVVCTSSNAVEISDKIRREFNSAKIGFGPDKNLGNYVQKKLGIQVDILPEKGHCYVHNRFTLKDIVNFNLEFPDAEIIVHPECTPDVVSAANFVGSTAAMYNYVIENPNKEFGIGTEIGLIDRLKREYPKIKVHPLSEKAVCYTMKKYSLEAIEYCLKNLDNKEYIITIPDELRKKTLKPVEKMFELMEK